MLRAGRFPPILVGFALSAGLFALAPGGRAELAAVSATRAAATENSLATQAAIDILKAGGNAADAAVTAALVAGVVSPTSSGLAGGGFALVLKPGAAEPEVIDFRETAPAGVDVEALARRPLPPEERGKLVGVLGEAQGLFDITRRFGTRPGAELVKVAERAAARGFPVSQYLTNALSGSNAAELQKDASIKALFYPGGKPAIAGRIVRNPKLAGTLRRLGAEGPSAIYDGAIASEISATVASAGGKLTTDDLKRYRVLDRRPLQVTYGDYTVFTMPPPSSGGLLVAQTLGLFSQKELERLGWGSGALVHLLAEGFRAWLADRYRYVADPDFVPVDTKKLVAPARLAKIRQKLALDRTHTVPRFGGEEHGTHHLVAADADGMVVSLTTTVNRTFGAKLVTPNSGLVLNDQLDDFNKPSDYTRVGQPVGPNLPRPGMRPTSSMTPTIVLRGGRPVLAIGGSGGMTIPTNVTQLLLGRLVFERSAEELVKDPRFYLGWRNSTLLVDPGAAPTLAPDLTRRGEIVETMTFLTTGVQLVAGEPGSLEAAADPRKMGSGLAIP